MNPLQSCQQFFDAAHIKMPFIPADEKANITAVEGSDTVFGTRKTLDQSLYDITAFVKEAISTPTKDYVLLGTDGHGVSSHAMHYYAVKGHIALFIQLKDADTSYVDGNLKAIDYLFKLMSEVEHKHPLPEGKRLVVVQSDFYGSGWGWVSGKTEEIDEKEWHAKQANRTVLFDALSELAKMKK